MFKKIYTKIQESFQTALVAAFIVLMVILLLYIPFKIIPKIMTSGSSFVATTISSLFVPNEKETTSKVAATSTKITTSEKSNPQIKTQIPSYYGKADLSISLIGTGIINRSAGQFYQTSYAGLNDIVGVKFEVKNIGTNVSGIWKLRLVMPSKTTPNYDSEYQISLRPGDRIEYVASFERPTGTGIKTGYIVADYFNNVDELTKTNNYLNVPIRIEGGNINDYEDNTIRLSCGSNTTRTSVGDIVTWSATVSGGIGQPLYSWNGSEGLLLIQSPYNGVNKVYYNTGTKTANVTVSIGGQTISGDCGNVTIR